MKWKLRTMEPIGTYWNLLNLLEATKPFGTCWKDPSSKVWYVGQWYWKCCCIMQQPLLTRAKAVFINSNKICRKFYLSWVECSRYLNWKDASWNSSWKEISTLRGQLDVKSEVDRWSLNGMEVIWRQGPRTGCISPARGLKGPSCIEPIEV